MIVWGPYPHEPRHVRLSVEEVCIKHNLSPMSVTVVVILHPQYVEVWQRKVLWRFHLDAIHTILQEKELILPPDHRYAVWESDDNFDIPDRIAMIISDGTGKRVLVIDER